MAIDRNLNFDSDICPILTLAAAFDKNAPKAVAETCRIDCAWYDTQEHKCAIMSINVYLKEIESVLNPPKAKPTVVFNSGEKSR